jgi:hypothetical protein
MHCVKHVKALPLHMQTLYKIVSTVVGAPANWERCVNISTTLVAHCTVLLLHAVCDIALSDQRLPELLVLACRAAVLGQHSANNNHLSFSV